MPEPGIVLNSDQIGDLHELLDHAETIAQWLLHATDEIIDDLAHTAYAAHFHPRSAVFWLVEDLACTQYRLHRALHPDTGSHDQDPGQDTHAEPAAQAATSATTSYRGRLDTSASIGNQIRPPRRRKYQVTVHFCGLVFGFASRGVRFWERDGSRSW